MGKKESAQSQGAATPTVTSEEAATLGIDGDTPADTLRTIVAPGDAGSLEGDAGKVGGFSLHAGVAAEAHESHKLEKLCRYITRPAISEQRLGLGLCLRAGRGLGGRRHRLAAHSQQIHEDLGIGDPTETVLGRADHAGELGAWACACGRAGAWAVGAIGLPPTASRSTRTWVLVIRPKRSWVGRTTLANLSRLDQRPLRHPLHRR